MADLRKKRVTLLGSLVLMGAMSAFGVAWVTNDVYTVMSYATSSERQQLNMYGGEIAFNNTGSYGFVRNVIRIDSPAGIDVTFVTTNSATPRPIDFAKDVFNPGGGQLVVSESVRFGTFHATYNPVISEGRDEVFGAAANRQAGGTGSPYLAPNAIRFANDEDSLMFTGRVALTAWPTCRYTVVKNVSLALYGDNMIPSDMIVDGVFTLPWNYFKWVNPACLPSDAKFVIPSGVQTVVHHATIDTQTGALTYPSSGNVYPNDIEVNGELLVKAQYATTFTGDITGSSAGRVNVQASSATSNIRRFSGDLSGFDGWLRVYSGSGATWLNNKVTRVYLDKNAPAGGIRIFASSNSLAMCSFYPSDADARAGDWSISRLQGDGVYDTEAFGVKGACWFMLSNQHLSINSLESTGLIVIGPTTVKNSCTLTIGTMASGMELVVSNGVPVTVGSVSGGKIRYTGRQVNTNAVNLAAGCVLGELEVPSGGTVTLTGGAVENVTGAGTLVVAGGDVRLGAVAATVDVQVQGGTVTFGSGVTLDDVTDGINLGLWVDASDYSSLQGLYDGFEFWGQRGQGEGTSDILGHTAYVYTNGFPLIERWYDKRPTARRNFFWQDRCVDYADTLYSYVYPYLIPGALNGRSVMSFGAHATTLDAKWSNKASGGTCTEARRMPLMRGHAEGGALRIYTAVMVFGSQNGGGRGLVGGYAGNGRWADKETYNVSTNPSCGGNYPRGGVGSNCSVTNAIFSSYRDTWVDGAQVDPTNTAPNGSWQIISFNGSGSYFRAIGNGVNHNYSGGQNYGEILVFTNAALTAVQRQAVENYLAMKWGLTNALPAKGTVAVAAGATVKGAVANVAGAGTWTMDVPESRVSMDGTFAGTVSGAGEIAVADAADLPSLDTSYSGAATVSGGNLTFTYADGAFAPALVAPNAALSFPASPTVTVTTGGATLETGEYSLVVGKSLAGLTDCTLVHDIAGMRAKLVRTATSLTLRVAQAGTSVIIR